MRLILPGQETSAIDPWARFGRHHHVEAYAALVIRGSCDEAGDRGRFQARPGDVLVHGGFDGHADTIGGAGALILNIRLAHEPDFSFGHVDDLDAIVRAFERDDREGLAEFHSRLRASSLGNADWPDLLAQDLARQPSMPLREWADRHGLHPASLGRGFRRAFGITPKRFAHEQTLRRAARSIWSSTDHLALIAAGSGFADQAHMTRAMGATFGATPAALRALGKGT
jgi:AraC-like DNA-binding protein